MARLIVPAGVELVDAVTHLDDRACHAGAWTTRALVGEARTPIVFGVMRESYHLVRPVYGRRTGMRWVVFLEGLGERCEVRYRGHQPRSFALDLIAAWLASPEDRARVAR